MAFNIILFSYSKPDNSTRFPSGGDTYPCLAVEPMSVINPSISFNQGNAWNPTAYNYAYIPDFRRYYWVGDWTCTTGRWYTSLTVDPLASWKSEILSLDEYVIRSASKHDGTIIDSMYPATTQLRNVISTSNPWPATTLDTGTFVLGMIGNPAGATGGTGGVKYYVARSNQMNALMNKMLASTEWIGSVEELSDNLLKCLVNPTQYITSVMWFPIEPWETGSEQVWAGWWNTLVSIAPYKNAPLMGGSLGVVPTHPQASRGSYLNKSPYTTITIEFPPFGRISLDPDIFTSGTDVRYQILLDPISGMATLQIYAGSIGNGIMLQAKIGVSLSVGQSNSSIAGALGSVYSRASDVAGSLKNGLDQTIFKAAGAIGDAVHTVAGDVNMLGYVGGVESYKLPATMVTRHRYVVESDTMHLGKPLCQKVKLSSLSGFTQVKNFDSNIGCTSTEHEMIKRYLEEGIFIE